MDVKQYHFEIFIDFLIDENRIDITKRIRGTFDCHDYKLKDALHRLVHESIKAFPEDVILVGVSHYGNSCNGNVISESYMHKIIRDDELLCDVMWH